MKVGGHTNIAPATALSGDVVRLYDPKRGRECFARVQLVHKNGTLRVIHLAKKWVLNNVAPAAVHEAWRPDAGVLTWEL